jgi:hypothetical protein
MTPITVLHTSDLKDILKKYTGSSSAPRSLLDLIQRDLGANTSNFYTTYSRGQSTLVFRQLGPRGAIELIEVFPKIVHRAWEEGISINNLQAIMPHLQNGAVIQSSWNGRIRLSLPQPLKENEILNLFKAGWKEYESWQFGKTSKLVTEMHMK